MHNPQMMGVIRVDHFNMKGSMCVIALFGVITIVSYFNELNKAGLLRRGLVPRPLSPRFMSKREEDSTGHDTIIQKNGDLHHIGLQIVNIKKNAKHGSHSKKGEINIKLHLGQNASYSKTNNSIVPIYNHNNSMPNFYTSLDISMYNISALNQTDGHSKHSNISTKAISLYEAKQKQYQKSVLVFSHPHEPHAYLVRDCLKEISHAHHLVVNNLSINRNHRKQWDSMSKRRRNTFQVLYGGLTFGVCETISRPCSYFTLMSHPLDRLAAIHSICTDLSENATTASVKQLCRLNNADVKEKTSLKQFIVQHGSSFFQKLVYYAKHCRLIGEDELCLQGSQTSFVFTPTEAEAHLQHILQHIETWFSTLILVDHLQASLRMLQNIYGYEFTGCSVKNSSSDWYTLVNDTSEGPKKLSNKERRKLLKDSEVKQALHADLAIYHKMVEIFKKQLEYSRTVEDYLRKAQKLLYRQKRIDKGKKVAAKEDKPHSKGKKTKNKPHEQFHNVTKRTKTLQNQTTVVGSKLLLEPGATGGSAFTFSRRKDRKDHDKLVKKMTVEGVDPLQLQNLSALELSRSHAEGARPGTLDKSNAVHLRHLPHPGITQVVSTKKKHKGDKNKASKTHS